MGLYLFSEKLRGSLSFKAFVVVALNFVTQVYYYFLSTWLSSNMQVRSRDP